MRELTIILLCTWKFAAAFPVAVYGMKMSFLETLFYCNIGGLLGMLLFTFFSSLIIRLWVKYWPLKQKSRHKKVFTKRNRMIVKVRRKYGLAGIVILSPVLLSIPVGSFLTAKYYGINMRNIIWLLAGQIGWSVIYTLSLMHMIA